MLFSEKKIKNHSFCLNNFWLQEPWQRSPVSQSPADLSGHLCGDDRVFLPRNKQQKRGKNPECSVSFAMCLMCSSCSYSPAVTILCLPCPHPRAAPTNPAGSRLCAGGRGTFCWDFDASLVPKGCTRGQIADPGEGIYLIAIASHPSCCPKGLYTGTKIQERGFI